MAETAGFNIATFRSHISANGVLRPNKFLARIYPPAGLTGVGEVARHLEYWGEGATLPGQAFNVHISTRYGYGNFEKRPDKVIVQDIQLVFISDANASVWSFFHQWCNMISSIDFRSGVRSNTYKMEYRNKYTTDIEIIVFDQTGAEKISLTLRDAFPIHVGDMPLNWGENNQIMRIPVVIAYVDWYDNKIAATIPPPLP